MSRLRWLLSVALAVAATPALLCAQERATIVGQVVDQATQQPLAGVQVVVVGTTIGALTNQQGRFVIGNARPGSVELRATLIGYGSATQPVTVVVGQTATANFALSQSAVQIEGLVVTATGEQIRRRELGNTVANIAPREEDRAATQNLTQLLTARAPGLVVQSSAGTAGTTARIRIRGANSVSLSNEPLLIIDGVRVNNSAASYSIGLSGQTVSRWNDINPEDIESIEVIKGPAGVSLYGTAAANGVIQITTRRGRAGRTQWSAFTEVGGASQVDNIPLNWAQVGTLTVPGSTLNGQQTRNCNIERQARGQCVARADSLVSGTPLVSASPFRSSTRYTTGLNASGGGEQVRFYLSGDWASEDGIVVDNDQRRVNLRANVTGQLREDLDFTVTSGYLSSRLRLPFGDNTSFGAYANGIRGSAFPCSPANPCFVGRDGNTGVRDSTSLGYSNGFPPSELNFIENRQDVERFIGGLTTQWRPLSWLQATAQAGMDINNRFDHQLILPNRSQFSATIAEGSRAAVRNQIGSYNAGVTATVTRNLGTQLTSTTSLGGQYLRETFSGVTATGAALLQGTGSLAGASARFTVSEVNQDVVTVSAYGQQQLGFRDRLFMTASLRGDDDSSFGADSEVAYYPGITGAWVVSEEPFFPQVPLLDNLRLRAAYGQSGQRPGFRQNQTFFSGVSARVGTADVPAVTVGGTGNAALRPEKSTELEYGFEAGFFGGRIGLDVTRYDKTTRDALVSRVLAPSLGASTTRFENLGEITNRGWEFALRGNVVDTRNVRWDGVASYATNASMITDLGRDIAPIFFNFDNVQRHQSGFPAGSFFTRRIVSFDDLNGDGIISRVNCPTYGGVVNPQMPGGPACEIVLGDSLEFAGTPLPGRQATISSGVTFFNVLRIAGQLDYRGDQVTFNSSEEFRCAFIFNCRGIQDRNAPLADQARAIGRLMGSFDGYIQDNSFWKLRELAVTLTAPESMATRFGASGLSLTLAGRNLKTWTKYLGVDPEVNSIAAGNYTTADFDAQPPLPSWNIRLHVNF